MVSSSPKSSSSYSGSLDPRVQKAIDAADTDGVPFRARTAYMHATWARTFSSLPELFIQPQSEVEVQKAIRLARLCRRRITTVGHAHSPSDLTCTSSWMLNLDGLRRIISADQESGIVVMEAGIRLYQVTEELGKLGLAFPIMGSVNEQSMAGVISTGTRGSSLHHGLLSESIEALRIVLANGKAVSCSATDKPELFRGALLSLGALGVITQITMKAVPAFALSWRQTIDSDARMLSAWPTTLWTQADFVRVWWLPYTRRAVIWRADRVTKEQLESGEAALRPPRAGWYDGALGYHIYHNLLAMSRWIPSMVPWIEWFIFGLQYGFRNGEHTTTGAVQPSHDAFFMNCLYSQYVTEWAIPLQRGPEALARLGSWLHGLKPGDDGYVEHGIPYSSKGVYVHAPIEVRVCDSTVHTSAARNNRPWLDSTVKDGPTLNINATLYRPYLRDTPGRETWFRAFEWLMRDLGGRPHWAKNFDVSADELARWYGDDMLAWRRVREECDPDGLFVGPWHRQHVLEPDCPRLPFEEAEGRRSGPTPRGGLTVFGTVGGVQPKEDLGKRHGVGARDRHDPGVSLQKR